MQKFTFVIDCMGKTACGEIRADMESNGFTVKDAKGTWLGDHTGSKKFPSRKLAEKEASALIKKFHKKMYQVTIT